MTSCAPSLILPFASAAKSVISRSLANSPCGVCVNFSALPSTSIASAIASLAPAPLNGAANALMVRPLIATGLSSASRSAGDVRSSGDPLTGFSFFGRHRRRVAFARSGP